MTEDRPTAGTVLACDVGGTRLRVARVDPDGTVHGKQAISTPSDDPTALARALSGAIDGPDGPPDAVVVGIPGPVDYSAGVPLMLPNLPQWEGHVQASRLETELGLPVALANDADLAALGEYTYGAGRPSTDMVYITVSTGVGAGVVLGGKLVRGRLSLAEIGHTIIDRRSGETVETLGSGPALRRLSGMEGATVVARAAKGDTEAARQFREVAESLAIGVFNLAHVFSPDTAVIGGGMSQAGDLLLGPVRETFSACQPGCPAAGVKVVPAEGGDDAGLKGAAALWQEMSSQ
jgi:glucokinase